MPWSAQHLAMASGYGAGVASPGWYEHLWSGGRPLVETWLVRTADLLRDEGFDISPAHLIEASRLAETTAALRGRSTAGLEEVNEAIRAVLTFGSDVPLALIAERLIIGTALGTVPSSVATAPLARDLADRAAPTAARAGRHRPRHRPRPAARDRPRAKPSAPPTAGAGRPVGRADRGRAPGDGHVPRALDAALGSDVLGRSSSRRAAGGTRSPTRPRRACSTTAADARSPRCAGDQAGALAVRRPAVGDGRPDRTGRARSRPSPRTSRRSCPRCRPLARSLRYGSVRGHDDAGARRGRPGDAPSAPQSGLPSAVGGPRR